MLFDFWLSLATIWFSSRVHSVKCGNIPTTIDDHNSQIVYQTTHSARWQPISTDDDSSDGAQEDGLSSAYMGTLTQTTTVGLPAFLSFQGSGIYLQALVGPSQANITISLDGSAVYSGSLTRPGPTTSTVVWNVAGLDAAVTHNVSVSKIPDDPTFSPPPGTSSSTLSLDAFYISPAEAPLKMWATPIPFTTTEPASAEPAFETTYATLSFMSSTLTTTSSFLVASSSAIPPPKKPDSSSTLLIVGITLGALSALALIINLTWMCRRARQKKLRALSAVNPTSGEAPLPNITTVYANAPDGGFNATATTTNTDYDSAKGDSFFTSFSSHILHLPPLQRDLESSSEPEMRQVPGMPVQLSAISLGPPPAYE